MGKKPRKKIIPIEHDAEEIFSIRAMLREENSCAFELTSVERLNDTVEPKMIEELALRDPELIPVTSKDDSDAQIFTGMSGMIRLLNPLAERMTEPEGRNR